MTYHYITSQNNKYIVVEYLGKKYVELKGASNKRPFVLKEKKRIKYTLEAATIYGLSKYGLTHGDLIIKEIEL